MPSPPITPLPQTARPPSYPVLTSPPLLHHPPLLARTSLSLPPTSFIFSASPLLFHPGSSRIALVHDTASDSYFLPRGRKDVGESLATCALREGFEESGFRGELISWGGGPSGTLQPKPPGSSKGTDQLQMDNKEAFWAQAQPIHTYRGVIIYFTYYFLAILPEDNPIPDKGKERLVGAHESGCSSCSGLAKSGKRDWVRMKLTITFMPRRSVTMRGMGRRMCGCQDLLGRAMLSALIKIQRI
ncbi:hypothetical protein EV426DRAFT_620107, partial [Tirmania nivea]